MADGEIGCDRRRMVPRIGRALGKGVVGVLLVVGVTSASWFGMCDADGCGWTAPWRGGLVGSAVILADLAMQCLMGRFLADGKAARSRRWKKGERPKRGDAQPTAPERSGRRSDENRDGRPCGSARQRRRDLGVRDAVKTGEGREPGEPNGVSPTSATTDWVARVRRSGTE